MPDMAAPLPNYLHKAEVAKRLTNAKSPASDDKAGVGASQRPAPEWALIEPATLQNRFVPEREFLVNGWLAPGHVTILYANGGTGKSLLAQQLMTSVSTGRAWVGLAVSQCPAIGLFCEDDEDELHRRQNAINHAYGIDFKDLGNMIWASGVGEDNALAELTSDGKIAATAAFELLEQKATQIRARLIVVDTAADTFDGNENDRRQVRQYVARVLGRLARDLNAAVLLNAHPSRTGMGRDGDLDGGSTAWSNTARARWGLARSSAEGQAESRADELVLTRRKANYASTGETLRLRWQNGVLVPIAAPSVLESMATSAAADAAFMDLLAKMTAEGRHVSHKAQSTNFAPKVFGLRPDRNDVTKAHFAAAMERLFAARRIKVEEYGRPNDRGRPCRIVAVKGGADA